MNKITIKPIALLIVVAIAFYSCQSEKAILNKHAIVKVNLEKYLKPKLHDPKSYEFGELFPTDSITYKANIKYHKDYYKKNLNADLAIMEKQTAMREETKKEINSEIEKYRKIIAEIERIEKGLGDTVNDIASYTFVYSFNSLNISDQQGSFKYVIQTSAGPEYKILKVSENMAQVLPAPNDFPGFANMLKKYE